ncbi:MAG: hypothetical protein ACLGXA_02790 [Acidobacteriota bacterium]
MTKSLRIAVLSTFLALSAAPVFAGGDPGSNDPPPPPTQTSTASATTMGIILTILGSMGA